jgi:hypothetical protein
MKLHREGERWHGRFDSVRRWRKIGEDLIEVPKGRSIAAQGNALGWRDHEVRALKGRSNVGGQGVGS